MPFARLLTELVARAPLSRGAIFCDYEGENVAYVVAEPPPPGCELLTDYDIKCFGAQLTAQWLLLREKSLPHGAGEPLELQLRAQTSTLLFRAVKDGYYVVLILAPTALTVSARRALADTALAFVAEI